MNEGEDQAPHHRGGDTAFSQELDALGEKSAQYEQEHGNACSLVDI